MSDLPEKLTEGERRLRTNYNEEESHIIDLFKTQQALFVDNTVETLNLIYKESVVGINSEIIEYQKYATHYAELAAMYAVKMVTMDDNVKAICKNIKLNG